jgi:hypothetical protein
MLNQEARSGLIPAAEGRQHVEHDDVVRLFRVAVQEDVAMHLAAGDPVFSCGLGDETGKLFMHTPDGRRIEVHRRSNGSYERIVSARA